MKGIRTGSLERMFPYLLELRGATFLEKEVEKHGLESVKVREECQKRWRDRWRAREEEKLCR